jgi:DedD protein
MAEQTTESDNDSTAGELRGQLVKRLAVAGVLVAILLGVLAFFDHLANLPDDSEPTVFTSRCRSRRKRKCRSRSRRPKTCLNHRPPEKAEVAAEAPPPPSVESQPAAVVEVKPEPAAESRSVVTAKPEPAARLAPRQRRKPLSSRRWPPCRKRRRHPPICRRQPKRRRLSRHPPGRPPVWSKQTVGSGPAACRQSAVFRLSVAGWRFSSAQRAEELHAKLTLSGVPSTLETRVQVGPFRTRQEAEAAQAKLKQLGVETILVPPKGKY